VRFKSLLALLGVAAVASGCTASGTQSVPVVSQETATNVSHGAAAPTSQVDRTKCGVSAHYTLFRYEARWGSEIVILAAGEVASFERFSKTAERLPNATIVYPDGSTQSTNSYGEFDAGESSYAQAHPEALGGTDVVVTIKPPLGRLGKGLSERTAAIFSPSEIEERHICTTEEPPQAVRAATTRMRSDGYVWSCNPSDYTYGELIAGDSSFLDFHVERLAGIPTVYTQHFFVCGTDQKSDAVLWSNIQQLETNRDNTMIHWRINYLLDPTKAGRTHIAAWASPHHYFLQHNQHVALLAASGS
jgi:hypothetical protein